MKKPRVIVLILLVILFSSAHLTEAQVSSIEAHEVLVYERVTLGHRDVVRAGDTYTTSYLPVDNSCIAVSAFGTYLAESMPDVGINLSIRDLRIQQNIIQIPWNPDWATCSMEWRTDTIISVRFASTGDHAFFDVSTGILTPTTYQDPPPVPLPNLPDWIPDIYDSFILPSPVQEIYLYERCSGHLVTGDGRHCSHPTEFVLYDVRISTIILVLPHADPTAINGQDFMGRPTGFGGAAWSRSGRYLAYVEAPFDSFDRFNLRVYDVNLSQYVSTEWINAQIDLRKAMQWSPTQDVLLFWTSGRLGEPQLGDTLSVRTPVVFDAVSAQFNSIARPFPLEDNIEQVAVWSPSGNQFAFVDLDSNLVIVDTASATVTIVDTDVSQVFVWTSEVGTPSTTGLSPSGFSNSISATFSWISVSRAT